MRGYLDYEDMVAGTTAEQKRERAERWAEQGVSADNFEWGEGNYSTTWSRNGEPILTRYYIWEGPSGELDAWLAAKFPGWQIDRDWCGNGHGEVSFKRVTPLE